MLSTRDKVLLAFNGNQVVSGGKLAKDLGVTRALVWKHVRELRKMGFEIAASRGGGYRLKEPFDFSLLQDSGKWRDWILHYGFETDSTQKLAKAAAEKGASESELWMVEKQSSGRGRLDRVWESGLGGLWFSLLVRPTIPPGQVPSLTLVTATVLVETINKVTGINVQLKWPNDLVIRTPTGWRKVAGILTEMSAEMDRTHWVVIGIGLNVDNTVTRELKSIATTLQAQTGTVLSRAKLLHTFLDRFWDAYQDFQKRGFEPYRAEYWKHYCSPDEAVAIKTARGTVLGIARGVDGQGALIVESENIRKSIWEGEIVC